MNKICKISKGFAWGFTIFACCMFALGCQSIPLDAAERRQILQIQLDIDELIQRLHILILDHQQAQQETQSLRKQVADLKQQSERLERSLDELQEKMENMQLLSSHEALTMLEEMKQWRQTMNLQIEQLEARIMDGPTFLTPTPSEGPHPLIEQIDLLRENYQLLRWLSYQSAPTGQDPFLLDDIHLMIGGEIRYTIQPGDTISAVVLGFGLGPEWVERVMEANGISDARSIRSGQVLTIPLITFKDRVTVPIQGKQQFGPDDIEAFFGDASFRGTTRGILFRTPPDHGITAVLPGKVIDQSSSYVVLYHGNELKTIYTLLNNVRVAKGSWVRAGDVLGYASDGLFQLELMYLNEFRDPMHLYIHQIGSFDITFYTEWDDGNLPYFPYFRRTKSGTFAREWYSIAADPQVLPEGTVVYIPALRSTPSNGIFVVEDIGSAIKGNRIDVYLRDINEAMQRRFTTEVFRVGKL